MPAVLGQYCPLAKEPAAWNIGFYSGERFMSDAEREI
jgi:hypothetical protein